MEPIRESFWNMPAATQWILYIFLAIALGIFGYGFYRRIRLWRRGQPNLRWDRPGKRIQQVVVYVLGQVKVANEAFPGLMHLTIFFGFLVLFIGTSLIFINDDLIHPIFDARFVKGPFYLGMEVVLDILGLVFLVGIVLALVRRYILRPSRLENRADDAITLTGFLLLGVGGFVLEGLRLAIEKPDWSNYSPIGYVLAGLFTALGATGPGARLLHQILWWAHAGMALGFIAMIPYTRLFHLITTPLNIFFRPLEPVGALVPIEDIEETEILGAAQLAHLPQKRLLDYESCTRCGRCEDVCPAYMAGQPLSPRQLIMDLNDFMLQRGKAPLLGAKGRIFPEEELELPGGVIASETLWACTTCMACMERCPVFIDHIGTIVELRRYMGLCTGDMPGTICDALSKMNRAGNPYGQRGGKLDWAEGLEVPLISDVEEPEILFWVGCAGAYDPRNQQVVRAVAELLQRAQVSFAVLGDEEQCCGDWARRAGEEYLFQTLAEGNIETLKQYKFKAILTACPHGYNTLKNEYPQFTGEFEVWHHSLFIHRLINEGRLRPTKAWDKGYVAYHDPCYLGRYNGVMLEPRRVLQAVPGLSLIEMAHNGRQGLCCGGGGGKMWMEEEPDKRVNQVRLQEVEATSADTVSIACPYCLSMLDDAVKVRGLEDEIGVLDMAEIVAKSLE
jgi:Fe-S oxidoreductase/nitrate reductase gamma subunit